MSWLQMHIDTNPAAASVIETALLRSGAISVTLQDNADQPLLEPGVGETPLWDAIRITALFEASHAKESIIEKFAKALNDGSQNDSSYPLPRYEFAELADQDWERTWLKDYTALQFGEKLWICPTWQQPPDPDAINIILDPGLAFGTGTHQTTALCLEWLEQASLQNKTVIDYGCGSGILAIAAMLLGAKSVICVDNDPQALYATQSNAAQNGIASNDLIVCLPQQLEATVAEQAQGVNGFDVVIANILAGPLVSLAPKLSGLVATGGEIILSGILDHQADTVLQAYQSSINFQPIAYRDEWTRLSGKNAAR